jgi:hypothetical protein
MKGTTALTVNEDKFKQTYELRKSILLIKEPMLSFLKPPTTYTRAKE